MTDEEIGDGAHGLGSVRLALANATDGRLKFAEAMYVVDYGIGLVVEAARAASKLENGVVIVHSDNGGMPCTFGGTTADVPGSNYPLRSGKFQYFEGGVRVPAFVYAPVLAPRPGAVYSGLMHHVDWLATIVVGLAGGSLDDADVAVDSLDHWTHIASADSPHDGDLLPAPVLPVGPRTEIVFDISTATYNLSYGSDAAPVDLRLPYDEAIVAYRYRNLKLLKRHTTDDTHYREDAAYYPNCTAMFCQMNRELYTTQRERCEFADFLFNLTADPLESTNLADDPAYLPLRRDLEQRAQKHFSRAFYQPLNHISRSNTQANHAFYKAGDVIVPWADVDDPLSFCQLVY